MKELYKKGYTQNRELSWLRFDERCLEEGADLEVPVLERMNFIRIFSSNLDEFFMVRVGSLQDLNQVAPENLDPLSGMTPKKQIRKICKETGFLYYKRDQIYDCVRRDLRNQGIWLKEWGDLDSSEREVSRVFFRDKLRKSVSVQFFTGWSNLPMLEDKQIYFLGELNSEKEDYFALVSISADFPRLLTVKEEENRFSEVLVSDLLLEYFEELMLPFEVKGKTMLRITRNAEIQDSDREELPKNFRIKMERLLQKREHREAVRLEVHGDCPEELRDCLVKATGIAKSQCFISRSPLDYKFLNELKEKAPGEFLRANSYPVYTPRSYPTFFGEKVMEYVQKQDIFSSYPYDSMMPLLRLLKEAGENSRVQEIRMTIYRLSNPATIADYLAQAAENGKRVRVLIELRARFDEQHNIDWSKRLEQAGCQVYYGSRDLDDYKVHCKVCQIVLNEMGEKRYITQVGTGNYNETTARQYTDFSLITYNQKLGKDVSRFFKNICKENYFKDYKYILAAPQSFKPEIIRQIDREKARGKKGRIFVKVNSVTDPDVIRHLSEASNEGVQIRMIVRGICGILPGVPKRTENIEIVNVVGRYLEHSRVYIFGQGKNERMYISSADLMTRNTEKRVELAFPVTDSKIRKRIKNILLLNYMDNVKGRRLGSDGGYRKKNRKDGNLDSQKMLMEKVMD